MIGSSYIEYQGKGSGDCEMYKTSLLGGFSYYHSGSSLLNPDAPFRSFMNTHQIYLFISLITIVNKVLLVVLFLFQRRNQTFNKIFAAIIGCAIPLMVSNLMIFLQIEFFIERVYISSAFSMLYFPLCVWLFHECLQLPFKRNWKFQLYLWIPIAYYILMTICHVFFLDEQTKQGFIRANLTYQWDHVIVDFLNIPMAGVFFGHVIYFFFFLKKAKKFTSDYGNAHTMKRRYRFVFLFIVSLIVISILLLVFTLFDTDREFGDMVIVPMSSNILTLMIVFFAFDGRLVQEEPGFKVIKNRAIDQWELMPRKEVLSADKAQDLKVKIDTFFIDSEKFLSSDFSLHRMADLLETTPHQISFVVNTEHEMSFSDLLAYHRIVKAKLIIESDDFRQMTIEAIGQSVGYKSKSTFFAHFKKQTGRTPLDFKKGL